MTNGRARVAIITGSRAEFGLLDPVMRAVRAESSLELSVIAAGSHLLAPTETWRDITAAGFEIAAKVEMQRRGETGRPADAIATGRGIEGFARVFADRKPDWVVLLGDRIEAFGAASAASIAGIAVAHLHGGDRAEGIADEAMRHAITKLAHLHLPATETSAQRILRMGERPEFVHIVGSPAIDGLDRVESMLDDDAKAWNDPAALFLLHPSGLPDDDEHSHARAALHATSAAFKGRSVLCLAPNYDPGRDIILQELQCVARCNRWPIIDHLPRPRFLSLLKRLASRSGVLIGNSSAGLIEAAALKLPAVNLGQRQAGRERPNNVIDAESGDAIPNAIRAALHLDRPRLTHPYGDGRTGERVARLLATSDPHSPGMLRKRCAY